MSLSKECLTLSLRLTAIALALSVAGCGLNPFSDDDEAPAPVQRTTTARTGSSSMDAGNAVGQTTYEPNLVLVEEAPTRVPLAEGHPDEYTVQQGDTLWDIASTFLKDPWYWPEVWYVNPQIENPHLIFPGDVLALVYIDGEPRVTTTMRGATYRLSPTARATQLTEAVTSIPYEQISAFLSKGLVLEKGQAERLPYIVGTRGDHMIAAAGNEVYVRGGVASQPGTRYSVVHVGDQLRDPDDNTLVGYQGIYVGEGLMARGGDPATVALTDTNREALNGDRLVPETVDIPLNFFPKAPDIQVDGRIISVVDGVSMIGQYQVVVINRGARNGLAPGDVLTVFQSGEVVKDRVEGGKVDQRSDIFSFGLLL
ncbi:MAG: LysM peptidoglycan-binding domain-containing protein, partial [Woeseiaceae bacterium]